MVKLANRVKVSTATTGTGEVSFGSAEAGYRTLNTDDDYGIYPYVIEDGDDYEVGEGAISIGKITSELDVSSNVTSYPYDIKFKPDGTELYVLDGNSNRTVYQYTLSTAWDLTTASYTGSATLASNLYNYAIEFNDDGTGFYSSGISGVRKYSLSTAWDISTLSDTAVSNGGVNYIYSLRFVNSGTQLVLDRFGDLRKYSLSTAYDATTINTLISAYNSLDWGYAHGFEFNSDGTQCFIADGNANIVVASCSTAYDLSSSSLALVGTYGKIRDTGTYRGVFRKDDDTLFAFSRNDSDDYRVHEITQDGVYLTRGLIESSTGSLLNLSGSAKVFISPNTNLMQFQSEWGNDPSTNLEKGNIPIGKNTLTSITSGYDNIAIGKVAGEAITDGRENIAIGRDALTNATGGDNNVAVGKGALSNITNSNYNIGIGQNAGSSLENTSGNICLGVSSNILNNPSYAMALGHSANATGAYTISIGFNAGYGNTNSSDQNVNIGYYTARLNGGGDYNVKIGSQVAYNNYTTGSYNVNIGYQASYKENSQSRNVNVGAFSNYEGQTNDYSVNFGMYAGRYNNSNDYCTNVGYYTGNSSTVMTGNYNASIGAYAQPSSGSASGQFTLGNGNITSLRCNDTSISSLSDERDKTNIQNIPYGLDFINDVRPVTFDWNRRDGTMANLKDVGFIAQDLADVELEYSSGKYTRLVDFENPEKLEARPQAMFPILVKAVQELSQKNDALEARIAALEGN